MGNDGLRVAAVVLTYNRCKLLLAALEALRRQSVDNFKIIIVDNASSDETIRCLREHAGPDLDVVRLEENVGAAGGFAHGLEYAYKEGHDLIWVMDDDVMPESTALAALLEAYIDLSDEHCPPNLLVSQAVSDAGEPMNVPVIDLSLGANRYPVWPKRLGRGLIPITQATFVGALIPRHVITNWGLPLAAMYIWGDDAEYTYRVAREGRCYLVAGSVVRHLGRSNALAIWDEVSTDRIAMYYYFYRNGVYFARIRGVPVIARQLLRYSRDMGRLIKRGRFSEMFILLRGVLAGFVFNPRVQFPS